MKKTIAITLLALLTCVAAYMFREAAQDARNEQAIGNIISATHPKPATQTPPRTDATRPGARHQAATRP